MGNSEGRVAINGPTTGHELQATYRFSRFPGRGPPAWPRSGARAVSDAEGRVTINRTTTGHGPRDCSCLPPRGRRPEAGGRWLDGLWGTGRGMQEQGRKVDAIRDARRYVTGFHKPQAARSESPDEAAPPLRSGVHAGRDAGARSLPTREHKGVEVPYPFGLYRMSIKVLPQATSYRPQATSLLFASPSGEVAAGRRGVVAANAVCRGKPTPAPPRASSRTVRPRCGRPGAP